jgi:heme/copper-type cytochrome/quinol oxidase subunit 2
MIAATSFVTGWAFVALAIFFQGEHNSLHPAGPFAANIEWLYWVIFWIVFVAFVLTILAFARASAKTYSRSEEMLPIVRNEEGDRKAKWAVGAAITITVLTLFAVLFMSVITGK